jgi:lambda family phage minor tail protein L
MTVFGDNLRAEKNKRHQGAYLWLAEVYMGDSEIVRVVSASEAVTFKTFTFQPFPFRVSDLNEETSGDLPTFRVSILDFTGVIDAEIRKNNDLGGNKVNLYKVPYTLIGTPVDGSSRENYRTWTGYVASTGYTKNGVSLTLESKVVTRVAGPRGKLTRHSCPFDFKGPQCKYAGVGNVCDKSLDGPQGCLFYGNVLNYGGFPGAVQNG